ncbi:MAG: type II toxin-antitoxin system Phd/YefM family antitoxin [Gammaproteobacteria bacterium]|nr:type II toxin-antitoxin system Phd/YefM family antitoxin [Gammaproteobacteria bacterium]
MKQTTIRDARNSLTRLLHDVESGKPVRLTRRGKPVAVIVSEGDYERLTSTRPSRKDPWLALQEWRAGLPAGYAGIADTEVESWRDRSPDGGRKSPWDA